MTFRAITTRVNAGGRIVIPSEFRKTLGLEIGSTVTLTQSPDGLLISTPELALRRLQKKFRSRVPSGRSLVDELIAERRAEAANE